MENKKKLLIYGRNSNYILTNNKNLIINTFMVLHYVINFKIKIKLNLF